MYTPSYFQEPREELLRELIEQNSFATLISVDDGAPVLTHLPFLLEENRLVAHMAKANPHWRIFERSPRVLVEFRGPHAYISPGWYPPAPVNVPTWNYTAVHVHGHARIIDDYEQRWRALTKLIHANEAAYGTGWEVDEQGVQSMLPAIVVFEIAIDRLEGKLKLSQQHPERLREGVARELIKSTDSSIKATGEWMMRTKSVRTETQ